MPIQPAAVYTNVVVSCPCGGKLVAEPRAARIDHEAALFRWWHGAGGEGKCGGGVKEARR